MNNYPARSGTPPIHVSCRSSHDSACRINSVPLRRNLCQQAICCSVTISMFALALVWFGPAECFIMSPGALLFRHAFLVFGQKRTWIIALMTRESVVTCYRRNRPSLIVPAFSNELSIYRMWNWALRLRCSFWSHLLLLWCLYWLWCK